MSRDCPSFCNVGHITLYLPAQSILTKLCRQLCKGSSGQGQIGSGTDTDRQFPIHVWRSKPFNSYTDLMRSFLTVLLLALLPLQVSFAAVAPYCGHQTQISMECVGYHTDQQHAEATSTASPSADMGAIPSVGDGNTPGALNLDCGHCHGTCGMMLNLVSELSCELSAEFPGTALDEAGGAHSQTRPERPQWWPLA